MDAPVKLPEKFAAVARIIFPGIFSVEEDRDGQRTAALHALREVPQPSVQVGRSRARIHPAVDKSNEVRKVMVAEHPGHLPLAQTQTQRRIQPLGIGRDVRGVARETHVQRPPQNAFIGGKPPEAEFRGERQRLIGNGTF